MGNRIGRPGKIRSEERRVGKVTGVQTCALPIYAGIVLEILNKIHAEMVCGIKSIQVFCLWGTELEDPVKSLRNSEGYGGSGGGGGARAASGGAGGDHFSVRRGEPSYEVR